MSRNKRAFERLYNQSKGVKKAKPKRHKYGAKKTVVDGIKFDSQLEAKYYYHLMTLKQLGQVKEIELQPEFLIQEKKKYKGETIRKIVYKLDFKVVYNNGYTEYIDVKGMTTPVSQLKLKLIKGMYPDVNFKWVGYSVKHVGGWGDWHEIERRKRKEKRGK